MLKRMRYYDSVVNRELKRRDEADMGIIDSPLKAANEAAKDAAPYIHPRLSAVEHTGSRVDAFAEMLKLIDGTTKGLPDQSRIPKDRDELTDVASTQAAPEPQAPPEAPTVQLPPKQRRG
jgi:hypothetical protein